MSGIVKFFHFLGLVYWGYSRRSFEKVSELADFMSPSVPGNSLTIDSTKTWEAISPPASI